MLRSTRVGRRSGRPRWLPGLVAALLWAAPVFAQPPLTEAEIAVATTAAGATATEHRGVLDLYAARAYRWAWSSPAATRTAGAAELLERLRGADVHGLRPDDYLTPSIRAAVETPDSTRGARVRGDVALTVAALRYLRHLHLGRVDPRAVGLRLETWAEPHDFSAVLAGALDRGEVGAALDGMAPPWPLYAQLREARRRYQAMTDAAWTTGLAAKAPVRPGDPFSAASVLRARLAVLGDLAPEADAAPSTFGPGLVAAVTQFQRRHGLAADGVLGGRTLEALEVPPSARLQQIDVALERLRWLPDLGARRVIAVNIPMFRLWAWNADPRQTAPVLAMDVIVGRAVRTETPVFVEALTRVIFRPYWNVPTSILRGEVLPALARDRRYLERQQMEIVRGPGDDAAVVEPTAEAIAQLAAGTLRLRQRPGPHNALGLVKFVFPNRESVFMHGTPTPSLFARARRDFSHGCIRVADPPALARWVLQDLPAWTGERIEAAMRAAAPAQVDLPAPIDVVLFYLTAAVVPDDGLLHFAEDVYGHDARLGEALARR